MTVINDSLRFLMNLTKVNSILSRRLTMHGLSFTDYMILYLLSRTPDGKMRRVDLAERVGLTSSAVTRMLVPMEKIGLVKREASERDARVSYVILAPAGKRVFEEASETAGYMADEIIPADKIKKIQPLLHAFAELGGDIV